MNFSQVSFFTLTAYLDSGALSYVNFSVVLLLYVLIVCANLLLIAVICVDRNLHQPMYMFLCSLFVNELYGSSALFPFLLVQLLSDVHVVSAPLCFLQIFSIYSYAHIEFYNLAVMAYDRYLAICFPLQYGSRMTLSVVLKLMAVTWLLPLLGSLAGVVNNFSLQLCGNVIDKIYCDSFSVLKLSCEDVSFKNISGIVYMFTVILGIILLIVYSYVQILQVCSSGSGQTRQKALSTCAPHLASLLNFSFGCFFDVMQSRFDMSGVPRLIRIVLALYFVTCPPLFNPLVYGLNTTKIRNAARVYLGKTCALFPW